MFFHFNQLGKIHATNHSLNPEEESQLRGFNFPDPKLANQFWKQWAIDYLEHSFTLNVPPNPYLNYPLDHE